MSVNIKQNGQLISIAGLNNQINDSSASANTTYSSNKIVDLLSNKADTSSIPTKTSDLQNDSDFVADASYVHTDNNFTDSLKSKVDNLGTAATKDVATSGDASSSQVVMGNDTRLTDSRTPTAHNQASNTINAMTGYSKPSSTSAIGAGDTLNGAIGKLEKGLDSKTAENPTFTEASSRANIASGESFATILGKIKKFFSDLKTVAFTGNASDLTTDSTHRLVTDAEKTAWNAKANIFVINVSQDEETENLICDKTPSEVAAALANNNIIQVVYVNDVYENEIYTLISDYLDSEDKIIFGCTYESYGIEIYSKTLTFYRDWSEDDVWESIELSVSEIVGVLRAPIFRINNAYSCIINYAAFKDAIENDQSISVYYNGSEYNSFKYDSANKTFYFSNTITESNHTTTKTFVMVGNNSGEWSSITMNEVTVPNVEDSLTSTSTTDALSAKQGKVLKDAIDGLNIPDKLADLSDDSTHRLVTDAEKTTWNNKSDFDGAYNSLTGKPTLGTASAKDVPTSGNASTTQVVMGDDTRLTDARNAADVYSWAKASTKPSYTASEVGAIATTAKGTANGVAELDVNGKVPSAQLPSFVDDVVEGYYKSADDRFYKESTYATLITPESGKSWVDISTNKSYRWTGSVYVRVDEGVQLGETSDTAYRGDRGKTAYDHSQTTSGNPHNVTKSDVGLSNVGNFKAVSTEANQGLTDTEKSNARTNIGAGTSSFSGSYSDLSDKPTLGTAAAKDVAASGNASATQVVMGNDTRLTDSRTPTSHTHGNIQNAGTLQTNDVTIANGDKLVITDSSDSAKIARASVSFDGSTTNTALTPKGTFETFAKSNTTYTFANGTNGFTVTPSGGSAQTVTVTPSIANNVTGSGTSGYLTKFNGANTVTNGPALGSDTTKFLRNDGTWQVPSYPEKLLREDSVTILANSYGGVGFSVSEVIPNNPTFTVVTDTDYDVIESISWTSNNHMFYMGVYNPLDTDLTVNYKVYYKTI